MDFRLDWLPLVPEERYDENKILVISHIVSYWKARIELTKYVLIPTLTETSLTKLNLLGSTKSTLFSSSPSMTIFPRIVPFSRSIFVSCLVSMPSIPGMPSFWSHSDKVCFLFQWCGSSHNWPMTSALAHIFLEK